MIDTNRRSFLKLMGSGAFAASMPSSIRKALDVPAHNRTRSISDVEHIVILTQENRSFDHYFGTMRGVRGFADPRAIRQPSGKPVWNQAAGTGELLPFRPAVENLGATFLPDPPHGWNDTHAAWNGGRHDQFVANKGVTAMTYHTRTDLPFHFALADAFTVCDAYHCSVMGPTDPNRYHLWTGWLGNDGTAGGPVITNAEAGYDWTSYPERLSRNGVSLKVYQDVGHGLTGAGFWGWTFDNAYIGNYGDNALLYLHQYQNAAPGTPLADAAKVGTNIEVSGTLFDQFRADVQAGTLPQVSWIATPEAYSEHPNWPANYGAWYVGQILEILTSNPDLWSRTAFLLNYDEEGGFFDHMSPPTPPVAPDLGGSTVDFVNEIFPGDGNHPSAPYGLGMRVPMIVVSPWSRGGWVNSQVFDHTSVIKFIETRFGLGNPDLVESNITPWRRAVTGDLTSAFDFKNPNTGRVRLPDTSAFAPKDRDAHPDFDVVAPTGSQTLPGQERGVRPARALPYALHAHAVAGAGTVRVEFANQGSAAAVFQARSANAAEAPRAYTVEPGKMLAGTWSGSDGSYDLTVHGPNGFYRAFVGGFAADRASLDVRASYDPKRNAITLTITNRAAAAAMVRVDDRYEGEPFERTLAGGESTVRRWSLDDSSGWYDLRVTVVGDAGFAQQFAGHVETGRDSMSDPALGGLVERR